jgi:hypothetical protein
MTRPRISVAGLMTITLVAGVGLVALRQAGEIWAGVMMLTAATLLGAAILGVVQLRGRGRHQDHRVQQREPAGRGIHRAGPSSGGGGSGATGSQGFSAAHSYFAAISRSHQ